MGILDLFRRKQTSTEQRALTANSFGISLPVNQVAPLNEHNALTVSAVYCAVNVIASSLAGLPVSIYRHDEQGKQLADSHPIYDLLNSQPNPDMGSFTYRHTSMQCSTLGRQFQRNCETRRRQTGRSVSPVAEPRPRHAERERRHCVSRLVFPRRQDSDS
jgi:phage portal protein BeeE